MISIDFIYVIYFSYAEARESLYSLKKFLYDSSIHAHIILYDNSHLINDYSLCEFQESINSLTSNTFRVTYIKSDKNLGFGKAVNVAYSYCISEYLCILNCDTTFNHSSLDGLLDLLSYFSDPSVAIIGPSICKFNGVRITSCFSFDPITILLKPLRHFIPVAKKYLHSILYFKPIKKRLSRLTYKGLPKNKVMQVDWVSGCCMFMVRSSFDELGFFDTRYFLYFEDVDICRKARYVNKKVLYYPFLYIEHLTKRQSAQVTGIRRSLLNNPVARYHIISWVRYCLKWRSDIYRKFIFMIKRVLCLYRITPTKESCFFLDFSIFKPYSEPFDFD